MSNLYIQEEFINKTENCTSGKSEVYETYTSDKGELYRNLVKEHGKCTGKVYIDTKNGETKEIGWVFEKRVKYEDADETFLQEVWVSVHKKEPKKTIEYFYA